MDAIGIRLFGLLPILVIAEIAWSRATHRGVYNLRESLSNLTMAVGNNLLRPISLTWKYWILYLVEPFQIWTLPQTPWAILLTFLAADCAYYWYHRFSHQIPVLWALHYTHHSSPWMNLTTAIRLNWVANFVSPLLFAPLVFLGCAPTVVVASLGLGLFYQFFLHTEAVGRLRWLDGWLLNTPAAHRVHHGSNAAYIDKNYGGALIVWDRLFGTYEPETETVRYGVTTGFRGHNPFKHQLSPLFEYLAGNWKREKQIVAERNARSM